MRCCAGMQPDYAGQSVYPWLSPDSLAQRRANRAPGSRTCGEIDGRSRADPRLAQHRGRIRSRGGRPPARLAAEILQSVRRAARTKAGQTGTSTPGLPGEPPATSRDSMDTLDALLWETLLRRPDDAADTGDWLSGRAPRSHRGGHWFDPSIAHQLRGGFRSLVGRYLSNAVQPEAAQTRPPAAEIAAAGAATSQQCRSEARKRFRRGLAQPRRPPDAYRSSAR
jgi:hypothetical protein